MIIICLFQNSLSTVITLVSECLLFIRHIIIAGNKIAKLRVRKGMF